MGGTLGYMGQDRVLNSKVYYGVRSHGPFTLHFHNRSSKGKSGPLAGPFQVLFTSYKERHRRTGYAAR